MSPIELLESWAGEGLHPGAQLFVRHRGAVVIDFACGEARPGVVMRADSIAPWYSSGKPVAAILVAQSVEQGRLRLNDRVASWIPEFAAHGKEEVTLTHLLTHTAGLRLADRISPELPWEEQIEAICATPLEQDWAPGARAGYSTQAAWFVLAEILQRLTGIPFDQLARRNLFEPLGMNRSWMRLPAEQFEKVERALALMCDTSSGTPVALPRQDAAGLSLCRPGASGRGPARELARVYQMLLTGGRFEANQILAPATVRQMVQPHRAGLYDETFLHRLDFGLGFILNSNHHGAGTVPYGYGRHASPATFGHSGAQSSCAFADPAHDLVVSWAANGMPGERRHQKRQRELNTAIYEFLGLAAPAPEG